MLLIKIHSTQMSPEHVKKKFVLICLIYKHNYIPNVKLLLSDVRYICLLLFITNMNELMFCRKDLHLKQKGPIKQAGGNNF